MVAFLSLSDLTKDLPAPPTLPHVTEAPPNAEEPSKLQCVWVWLCLCLVTLQVLPANC